MLFEPYGSVQDDEMMSSWLYKAGISPIAQPPWTQHKTDSYVHISVLYILYDSMELLKRSEVLVKLATVCNIMERDHMCKVCSSV